MIRIFLNDEHSMRKKKYVSSQPVANKDSHKKNEGKKR